MPKQRASLRDRPLPAATSARPTDSLLLGQERERREVLSVPPRDVMPNRLQPRTRVDENGLEDLAQSIRQHGVLEPLLVRPISLTEYEGSGRRYEIIAGERRWRASMRAGLDAVPVIVLSDATDDRMMLELAITENLQREDLHPLDEAAAFARMQADLGYSYEQIGQRLGKSKGYVQNRLQLLTYDEDLQRLVNDRPDTLKHVEELARIPDPAARAALVNDVRNDNLSYAETRRRARAIRDPEQAVSAATEPSVAAETTDENPEPAIVYSREYARDEHHHASGGSTGGRRRSSTAPVLAQEISRVRQIIQSWKDDPAISAQDRMAVQGELAGLLHDLEEVIAVLAAQDLVK